MSIHPLVEITLVDSTDNVDEHSDIASEFIDEELTNGWIDTCIKIYMCTGMAVACTGISIYIYQLLH